MKSLFAMNRLASSWQLRFPRFHGALEQFVAADHPHQDVAQQEVADTAKQLSDFVSRKLPPSLTLRVYRQANEDRVEFLTTNGGKIEMKTEGVRKPDSPISYGYFVTLLTGYALAQSKLEKSSPKSTNSKKR